MPEKPQFPHRFRQAGLSLLEILVVLLILAITFSVAIPVYQRQVEQLRVQSSAQEVLMSLRLARSEAIRGRQQVSICSLGEGACAAASTWQQGWRMEFAASDHPRKRQWSLDSGVTIEANGKVAFNSQGVLVIGSSQELNIQGPQSKRCIAISPMGHSRLTTCQGIGE